uniref:trem-like transcript 4 protein n=1 Tax=Myodes glareolus TaxID=447135 RepID=UPI0020201619|nr:trem-like transcript 4 protein [Myodes glareolus]
MAWEATYLLSPILLVLLASGSWAQDAELLPAVEGQTIFVKCQYNSSQHSKEKIWCQKTSTESCKSLVSSLSTDKQWPKFFIREYPKSHFFTVTMTTLTVRDSGLYVCGISGNSREIIILKSIYLAVSKGHPTTTASAMIPTWTRTKAPPFNTTKDLSTVFARFSISSIVVLIVCGLLIKTLIFTVLFAVTWRSFGGQTTTTQR